MPKKKVLALLNPFGGMGLAPRKWEIAKEIIDLAHIDITLKETERAGHAKDICQFELAKNQYDGLVTISGDGLIHESINGIMNRPDREEFLESFTFGFIPAGTGNGLHKSIMDDNDELHGIHEAAFSICKGRSTKLDLTELELEYLETKVYMFLSLSWAIISDCDINSEIFRCCGPPRFTVWGVYRVLNLRHYPGSLTFKGERCKQKTQTHEAIENFSIETVDGAFKYLSVFNTSWISTSINCAPLCRIGDGTNDIVYMKQESSRF